MTWAVTYLNSDCFKISYTIAKDKSQAERKFKKYDIVSSYVVFP